MATKYGSGVSGLADESANGLYIADFSNDISTDEVFLPNHVGEDVGVTFFNEQSTLSANGGLVTTSTTTEAIAGEVAPVAGNLAIGTTDSAVADWFCNSINIRGVARGYMTGGWTAVGRPGITNP